MERTLDARRMDQLTVWQTERSVTLAHALLAGTAAI